MTKGVLAVVFVLLSAAAAQTRVPAKLPLAFGRDAYPVAALDKAVVAGAVSISSLPIPTPTSCPNVDVSCPDVRRPGEPLTFTANISGGDPTVTPTFKWKVSAGTITSGQDTSSITVDTSDAAGQAVTATVEVVGYIRECGISGSCTLLPGLAPTSRKVDEYGDILPDEEKSRLDLLAVELEKDPTAQGYFICYGGRRSEPGGARRRCERARGYLVKDRGVDFVRLVALDGGLREDPAVEFWVVPTGAQPPQPTPNVFPSKPKPPARKPVRQSGPR